MADSNPQVGKFHQRKHNLMSIITSLHKNATGDSSQAAAPQKVRAGSMAPLQTVVVKKISNNNQKGSDTNLHSDQKEPQDQLSSLLNFLYQAASSKLSPSTFQEPQTELGDPPLLELQPSSCKSGVLQLVESLANGTPEVKAMLKRDVDVIFECRRCRGMFRALPNFIRHKKEYCKDRSILDSVSSREDDEPGNKESLPSTSKPETSASVVLSHIPTTSNAMLQNVIVLPNAKVVGTVPPQTTPNITISRFNSASSDGRPLTSKVMITKGGSFATLSRLNNSPNTPSPVQDPIQKPHSYPISSFTSHMKIQRGKPACPICNKEMAERKSVRRHLVRVHMLSVMESLKLMHSKDPTVAGAKAIAVNEEFDSVKCESMKALCKEILEIGDSRKVHVLPSNYEFSSNECCLCSRVLCSRTNLKRHMLEAHNFVLKSERKYQQLKSFAERKDLSSSPTTVSTRELRYLLPVQFNTPVTSASSLERVVHSAPKGTRITLLERVVSTQGASPALSHTKTYAHPSPKEPLVTTTGKVHSGAEHGNKPGDGEPPSDRVMNAGNSAVIHLDAAQCKCLTCDKKFSRRQTLQSHMVSVHGWTKEKFGEVYDKSNMEAHNGTQKSSGDETASDDSISQAERGGAGILAEGESNGIEMSRNSSKILQKLSASLRSSTGSVTSFGKRTGEDVREPDRKRPRIFEIDATAGSNGMEVISGKESAASHKLVAISKLKDVSVGKKLGMGTITVPLNLKVALKRGGTAADTDDSAKPQTTAVVPLQPLPATYLTPENGVDLFKHEATGPMKRLVLRRLVTTTSSTPPSTSVTTKNPPTVLEMKRLSTDSTLPKQNESGPRQGRSKKTNPSASPPEMASPPKRFDILNRVCYACDKTFDSQVAIKRHLLELHSFSIEDALAASYDCSDVSNQAQKDGQALGFDIMLAKCLICDKYYFSRDKLAAHMSKIHHLQAEDLRQLRGSDRANPEKDTTESDGETTSETNEKPAEKKPQVKKSARIEANKKEVPLGLEKNVTTMQRTSATMFSLVNGVWMLSKETIAHALKVFPKECVNAHALRCVKCRHKYKKAWDLKVHILKHVPGLGLYACKYCPGAFRLVSCRSKDLQKHLRSKHGKCFSERDRNAVLNDCRVDNRALWKAYGLPAGKF